MAGMAWRGAGVEVQPVMVWVIVGWHTDTLFETAIRVRQAYAIRKGCEIKKREKICNGEKNQALYASLSPTEVV
jgi:hypothetical protein